MSADSKQPASTQQDPSRKAIVVRAVPIPARVQRAISQAIRDSILRATAKTKERGRSVLFISPRDDLGLQGAGVVVQFAGRIVDA